MEKCQHVSKIRPAWDHSILNPQKWMCYMCRTTESVWACLSCSNVACGRFNEKHALDHYLESKHPISIEVNEKYIYCYVCDDYVMNDNAAGDLKLLRSALSAIATQKFTDIESRGRRLLRSYSHTGIIQRNNTDEDDKLATAAWHQRQRLLAKVFGAWRLVIQQKKMLKKRTPRKQVAESVTPTRSVLKKRTIIPGVTGLRNLGNSCYMNSVLQVLSHIEAFRDFFLKMKYGLDVSPNGSPQVSNVVTATTPSTSTSSASSTLSTPSSSSSTQSSAMRAKLIQRQTTVDCFQHLMTGKSPYVTPKRRSGGLNGGSNQVSPARQQLICEVESTKSTSENISLCAELHGLFRVLWSGKWAQVSPHAFLRAVWKAIPMFKGYAQHDAQEFLCELLDKIQRELDSIPKALRQADSKFLTNLFQGQLVSQVTCLACGNVSETYEPYLDLSLEFPDRYQITKQNPRIAQDICHITEMLAKFTEEEQLEGKIYSCEKCNKNRNKSSGKIYTEAKKQLLINRLPPFLRLHLKRFRWSGRNHREKISTHVAADEHLDLKPFCSDNSNQTTHTYHLFGVIIHHGKGFSSGHYTAYTWNCEADSWVNCNDSRMILSPLEEVLTAQAYILFYRVVNVEPEKFSSLLSQDSNTSAETLPYSLESEDMLMIDGEDSVKSHRQSRSLSKSKLKSGKIESALTSSFKADGTEMFMSLDQLEGDESMMSEASVQVVDEEISFNFKSPLLEEIENQTIEKGVKRSLTCTGKEVEHHDTKRKRLSFEAGMFYTKTPEKTVPVKDSSCMSELSSNSVFPNKFVKDLPQSCTHVKRRKSTFW